jgi:membrane fusion protein (multidrug efflux system)
MNKNLLALLITICSVIWISSCTSPASNPPGGAVPVNLQEVKFEQATYFDQYAGNIVALNEVELRSEVNGFITGIFFQEGQPVRKGQKLYEIEHSKFAAAYSQADANVQIAKANLEKATKDSERYSQLGQQGMATKQRLDYVQTDVENAKMQVISAEAERTRANTDLEHAIIVAPFDGTIGFSLVRMGTFVSAGQTLLNTISSDDPIAADFSISQKEISRFINLKQQKVNRGDSLFTLVLPDETIYPYSGQIEVFDRAVDPQTGTLKIRLKFPNVKHELKAGMGVNVRVINKNAKAVALVPFKAVTEQMGEFFIYVVEKDTARQHKVKIGPPVRDKVIVFSGLNPGEQIVVEGIQKLRDGTAVQIGAPKTIPSDK